MYVSCGTHGAHDNATWRESTLNTTDNYYLLTEKNISFSKTVKVTFIDNEIIAWLKARKKSLVFKVFPFYVWHRLIIKKYDDVADTPEYYIYYTYKMWHKNSLVSSEKRGYWSK